MNGWRLLLDEHLIGGAAAGPRNKGGSGSATLAPALGAGPGSGLGAGSASTAATGPALTPVGRPLLCISDIHGDLWALESVLAAVKHLDLCGIVVAGDHCVGGDQPFEVWTRLCSLGAQMARGPSDLALGALSAGVLEAGELEPSSDVEEARLAAFLRTKQDLGDVVCRRLADLPSTLVVSLDDTRGVMVMHGSPTDDCKGLVDDDGLADEVACVAEDVLVTGATHRAFARRVERKDDLLLPPLLVTGEVDDDDEFSLVTPPPPLLVVNAGSVGLSPTRRQDGRRTAFAVLVAPAADGRVHAWGQDILVVEKAARTPAGARSVG